MAGSNFLENRNPALSGSPSPRASLYTNSNSKGKRKFRNQASPVVPSKGSKRRHHHLESPNTTIKDCTPKSKIPSLFNLTITPTHRIPSLFESPTIHPKVTFPSAQIQSSDIKGSSSNRSTPINGISTSSRSTPFDDSTAVPVISLSPPMPSQLPSPPKCWMVGIKSSSSSGSCRQDRKIVTQGLMCHLASSGILVACH